MLVRLGLRSGLGTTSWTQRVAPSTWARPPARMRARIRRLSSPCSAFLAHARSCSPSAATPPARSGPSGVGGQSWRKPLTSSLIGAAERTYCRTVAALSSADLSFVTGASGFIGSAVVRALINAGFPVRALVRPNSPRINLDGLDIDIEEGDMRDSGAVRRAVRGARYVFHVAADYRLWARNPQAIMR